MANTVIDRYVTPENLPVLLGYRRIWRGTVQPALGYDEPPTVLADTLFAGSGDRPLRQLLETAAARRHSLAVSKVVVEVEDKYNPGRSYIGTLELRGLDWKLTELTVAGAGL